MEAFVLFGKVHEEGFERQDVFSQLNGERLESVKVLVIQILDMTASG